MDSTTNALVLANSRSHDSNVSGHQSTTSRQVDCESVDDGEKSTMLREDLDSVMSKLQLIDDLAESCIVDSSERLREFKDESHKDDRESLRELYAKLKSRDDHIASLNATCEKLHAMDKSKFEQIRRLEAIISTNENLASERIFLKNEISDLKAKLDSIETSTSDTFILEKLNLAYQDLIAIYDLRADIGQLLDELHDGVLNPVLQKNIVRLIREKELALHSKIGNK